MEEDTIVWAEETGTTSKTPKCKTTLFGLMILNSNLFPQFCSANNNCRKTVTIVMHILTMIRSESPVRVTEELGT